jgi:peptidoglycan hydrolase-like protein with peptidoglycan-binding domain
MSRPRRKVGLGLAGAVALAVGAWIAGDQIRSPAQIAAETAPPTPSAITAPVERRVLSSEVIVRGTVRYGSPQPVVLATSEVKGGVEEIVTTRPRLGTRVGEGSVAMSISGRPVFVLRGAQASHRDLGPGAVGPDVRQLESALARMGFFPGSIDGRYDGRTAAAVADWYRSTGWEPFGPTTTQLDQLRTAEAAAAAARDLHLNARLAIQQAAEGGVLPGDIAQARIDLETARDAVDTAALGLRTARIRIRQTRDLARQTTAITLAILGAQRDNQLAAADVALKQAAVNRAVDARAEAQRALAEAPPATPATERAALQAAVRAAEDDVVVAQSDLNAARASAAATAATGRDAIAKARSDRRTAIRDSRTAGAELIRARRALPTARRQVVLAARRLQVLRTPRDTSIQRLLAESAAKEASGTAADVARLARKMGITVPANEVLFFPTLPLRVDTVRVRRGDSVTGQVMTVSNSRLGIDSSLSLTDAKLVRRGALVKIEEQDLGVRASGAVTQVADRPGTHKVDPSRVYLEVTPDTAPAQLVGASVKLTIAVKSTDRAVLAVPVTALSVGADGSSRVQVQRQNGRSEYVSVVPGLAAQGLVEVRPVNGALSPGSLVVVGSRARGGTQSTASLQTGGPAP